MCSEKPISSAFQNHNEFGPKMYNKKFGMFVKLWNIIFREDIVYLDWKTCSIWFIHFILIMKTGSWSWSHGSWIYNYPCNDVVSSNLDLCEVNNIMWWSLSVTWNRSVVSLGPSTNKTDRQNITEILLKAVLNIIKQTNKLKSPYSVHS